MTTVTLCGSSRFAQEFIDADVELSYKGLVVINMSVSSGNEEDNRNHTQAQKECLDLIHFQKILISDAILVLGDGYIGYSTSREIIWADMLKKQIISSFILEHDWERITLRARYFETFKESPLVRVAKQRLEEICNQK